MTERGRISKVSDSNANRARNKYGEIIRNNVHFQYSGPLFSELPKDIMLNIFFRLFIKSIIICKRVCKAWRNLISDPEFAKLHFDKTCDQVYPVIHASDSKSQSDVLYLAQLDKNDFELRLHLCDHSHSNDNVALDTQFDLPSKKTGLKNTLFGGLARSRKGYHIVNSCNGLLCLSHRIDNRYVVLYNPIIGEFTFVPKAKKIGLWKACSYGFGFSHAANEYKVVRIIPHDRFQNNVTIEIHVVGTKSWREIGIKPNYSIYGFPTYLNGFLYWSSSSKLHPLVSFDIENECMGLVLGPQEKYWYTTYVTGIVGVLKGKLSISLISNFGEFQVWSMKDNGGGNEWYKAISINQDSYVRQIINKPLRPLKIFNDGSLLMFGSHLNTFIRVDVKNCRFQLLKIREMDSKVISLVAHSPSLVSLKHSLLGQNVKVLNRCPRRRELKLQKPFHDLHIAGKEFRVY